MTHLLPLGLLLSTILTLAVGCSSTQLPGKPHLRVANHRVDITQETIQPLVEKIRPYALMSELAYQDDKSSGQILKNTDVQSPKADVKSKNGLERSQGWQVLDRWLKEHQWELFQGNSKLSCNGENTENLEFDIWLNKSIQPHEVVVAFRGTDDNADWLSNLRGLLPSHRGVDQYARIHKDDFKAKVMDACANAGTGVVVTATGHSLGGGLAQHLFYVSQLWETNRISRVTVFDSSPMTGWHQFGEDEIKTETARENFNKSLNVVVEEKHWKFPQVMATEYGFGTIRVNERGEVLAYARFLFRVFSPEDPFISVLNFNFTKGEPIGQHSMSNLAFRLLYYPESPQRPLVLGAEAKETAKIVN